MTLTFNPTTYSHLLGEVIPKVIETEGEYDRTLAIVERLTFAKNRSLEEIALYKLLVLLIEAYESENYPMEQIPPHEALQHIMEVSGTHQADLLGILGSTQVVSEVLDGTRAINKTQAEALAQHFKVSPDCFSKLEFRLILSSPPRPPTQQWGRVSAPPRVECLRSQYPLWEARSARVN